MAKPQLVELMNLPDPLLQDNFNMYFTSAPALTEQEIRQLRLQCMSTAIPGRTIENALVPLFGYQLNFAGRNTTTGTFTVTLVETRALFVNRCLKRWTDMCRSKLTGHGVSKVVYAGRAVIELLSEGGLIAGEIELINVWPETLPETNLDGSATGIVQNACTFKFDEFVWRNAQGAEVTSAVAPTSTGLEDDA